LRQILVNLVGNGVKFTEAGEVMVSVSARRREGSEYEIHFRVRDTGIGIPEDKIGRLFQFFSQVDRSTTRQYGGTGLGLAISKKLAELMGGRIWVESTEGEGSTFQFVIVAGAAAGADAPQVVPPALAGKRILVVDDNATTRQILVKHLERRGAEAVASASGADALAIAREALDLAVIDQEMPEIDGFTLAKQLRQIPGRRSLPLVLLASTAQAASDGGRHLFAAVHAKPVKPERLCQLIGEVLGGPVRQEHQTRSEFDAELAGRIPLKILVAEDNTVNQRLALRMLQKMGYQADIVENGLEVLDALQRERYEVILMDVQMPRMDGLETTRHIRTRGVEGPRIIAMTANAIHGDREKCLEAGMDDYVSKPIQIAHLQAALARCEKSPVPQK
jgi:CheY-like chemotaxis protein